MFKKLFALASMTALTGAVAAGSAVGCSTTTTEEVPGEGGAGDAKADTGKKEGGPVEEDSGTVECPKNVAVTAADLDSQIGWKKPVQAPGVCSQTDITTLEANFKDTSLQSWFDLGKNVSDPCKACVFAKDTDANWQIIVGTAQDNGQTGFINFGACFGFIEGDACGKSLQYEQFCYNIVCNECTSTSTERQKCVQKAGASGGPCSALGDSTGTNCPKIQDTAKACNTVFDAVKTLCGSGVSDGGTD